MGFPCHLAASTTRPCASQPMRVGLERLLFFREAHSRNVLPAGFLGWHGNGSVVITALSSPTCAIVIETFSWFHCIYIFFTHPRATSTARTIRTLKRESYCSYAPPRMISPDPTRDTELNCSGVTATFSDEKLRESRGPGISAPARSQRSCEVKDSCDLVP